MPSILYIDQNHLSVFGKAIMDNNRYPEELAQYEYLKSLVDRGDLVIPISNYHIIETSRYMGDPDNLDGYCRAVEGLSGNVSILQWNRIFDYETEAFYNHLAFNRHMPNPSDYCLGSYADLLNQNAGSISNVLLKESIDKLAAHYIAKGFPKKKVRLGIKLLIRTGKFNEVVENMEKDKDLPLRHLNITEESFFSDGNLKNLVLGSSAEKIEAERLLLDGAMKFKRLVTNWFKNPIANKLREIPDNMYKSLGAIIGDIKKYRCITGGDDIDSKEMRKSAIDLALKDYIPNSMKRQGLTGKKIFNVVSRLKICECKPILSISSLITIYIRYLSSFKGPTPRKEYVSDVIDIRHCLYIPYVDVFLTENNMAALMKNIGMEYGTKVISKRTDLCSILS